MDRIITETARDRHDTIQAIRGYEVTREGGRQWLKPFKPLSRQAAVKDRNHYFVAGPREGWPLIPVQRVDGATCEYLRSRADGTPRDNLAALRKFPWPMPRNYRRPLPQRPDLTHWPPPQPVVLAGD